MGSTTQKYSLKWNDFTVNVASTFRDLHSRHDFVDVTLACADGSTLEAHKVILSSVSSYFRDILKTTPCKHPIIILKDTGRDEASAMLEFAYTGEVNVAQDLLPSLLHTARSFRIKGLDKVENPIDAPPPRPDAQTPSSEHWMESAPATRSHTPSSIHSASHQDIKPPQFNTEHFLSMNNAVENKPVVSHSTPIAAHTNSGFNGIMRSAAERSEREMPNHHLASPPPSLPNSQPPTREASPAPLMMAQNARTPPPKRWKRSFDMAHPSATRKDAIPSSDQPLSLIAEDYSQSRPQDYEPAKRFCEPTSTNGRSVSSSSGSGSRTLPYPHSMPTSPTMFERGNEARLAGLIRHHLANESGIRSTPERYTNGSAIKTSTPDHNSPSSNDQEPMDYRCYNNQTKAEHHMEGEYPISNGRGGHHEHDEESNDRFSRGRPGDFRPESAPTVLNMSPECSLSGPPSIRNANMNEVGQSEDIHGHLMHNGDELSDSVAKAFSIAPDGMGRYTCDECGKIFKHPGSLQHHRHIHRGTHRCPSCGKAFSRRWDMERHLNKSKYGCPANRFSIGSSGSNSSTSGMGSGSVAIAAITAAAAASVSSAPPTPGPALVGGVGITATRTDRLELITSMANGGPGIAHNTTA